MRPYLVQQQTYCYLSMPYMSKKKKKTKRKRKRRTSEIVIDWLKIWLDWALIKLDHDVSMKLYWFCFSQSHLLVILFIHQCYVHLKTATYIKVCRFCINIQKETTYFLLMEYIFVCTILKRFLHKILLLHNSYIIYQLYQISLT